VGEGQRGHHRLTFVHFGYRPHQLQVVLLIIGLIAVLVFAGLGYLAVRLGFAGWSTWRTPPSSLPPQSGPAGRPWSSRTEVGRLANALNGMLGQIETAFREREAAAADARTSEQRMRRFIATPATSYAPR